MSKLLARVAHSEVECVYGPHYSDLKKKGLHFESVSDFLIFVPKKSMIAKSNDQEFGCGQKQLINFLITCLKLSRAAQKVASAVVCHAWYMVYSVNILRKITFATR